MMDRSLLPAPRSSYAWNFPMKIDANVVGQEIEGIAEEHEGQVTADLLLEKATPTNSPLHEIFEWDDTKAAHGYRRIQAGYVLRNLRFEYSPTLADQPDKIVLIRALVNIERKFYSPVEMVMADDSQRKYALEDLRQSLSQWRRKSETFQEFMSIHRAIDDFLSDSVEM